MDFNLATTEKVIFLDFDDVIFLNSPYGGHDVFHKRRRPVDLWERLFDPGCLAVLGAIHQAHLPKYVLTTSWIDYADRSGFEAILKATGLSYVAQGLHEEWSAPQGPGMTRADAIRRWLSDHPVGRFLVLDDEMWGVGLKGWPEAILCRVNEGLVSEHADEADRIFRAGGGKRKT